MSTITQKIASGKHTLSLEFFPPKSEDGKSKLLIAAEALKEINPNFVSITYGAGGSTRRSTFACAEILKNSYNYSVMPHLTCVGHSKSEISRIIEQYHKHGYQSLMALRGDTPKGMNSFLPHPEGFNFANQLVRFIKAKHPTFEIGVGGYPEKHPESASISKDILNLKKKTDAGADFITTQLFYNNAHYYTFVKACKKIGIKCPIIPGIMIPSNLEKAELFCKFCQVEMPEELKQKLEKAAKDKKDSSAISIDWTYQQIKELVEFGVPGVHLYIMNQSENALKLYRQLMSSKILIR